MVTMFEKIDELELGRSRFKSYDLSKFAPELGFDLVSRACGEIRRIRDEVKIAHRTWQDDYVVPTIFVCNCLAEYRTEAGQRFNTTSACSFARRIDPLSLTLPPGPRERRDPVVRPLEP